MNFKLLLLLLLTICLVANAEETSPDTQTSSYNQPISIHQKTINQNKLEVLLLDVNKFGNKARAIYFRYINPWNDSLHDLGLRLDVKYLTGGKLDQPNDLGFGFYISSDQLP